MEKGGKSKNFALKGIEEESDDSEDEDGDEDKVEDLIFIVDEIIKLLQFRKNDKDKPLRKFKSSRKPSNWWVTRTRTRTLELLWYKSLASSVFSAQVLLGSSESIRGGKIR
ncbi:hypothetical protein CMV_002919 [Castanea mollissima]|uniref:Uncharacterized protein n=1 Tax=Castanea mollissima TaxID=60419 RepID=A0A8J4RU25_9ROSI|nr:hypothetical protein CMV_002919 [Castanea mollissima]